jgi:serine/threonine-protein kinase
MPGISKDRWQVISPYLDRALELAGGERSAWLASLRAEDPGLADDLKTLLEERDAMSREGFLEGAAPALPPPSSLAGQTIGPYTLVSLIGQGGMGSVWLARRSDGRFEGVAAVKLLNAALVGRSAEERFKREGGILARLADPHVAHLLDAGVSPGGQPYLVLEHVEGEHIDRYCDTRGLPTDTRVRLFLDVLEAVAHAHANLIVHRDIKPSNVLVRTDGQVKLLDFGIAKLLEGEASTGEATLLTREGGRALTPEYAAPEQLTGGPITTATDVYSLGVLLYLLLGGRHPAEPALRSPADLLKAVVDTEPQRLSDSVADTRARPLETLESNAARRATTPDRLRRLLRGDLDTIVARTLKKNPEERYTSVAALAADLLRHLDYQPIGARPDTVVYRAGKFVRRNRTPVALATLAVLGLAAGLVGTVVQARRATRQAALAEAQRNRADREARAASEQRDFALRQLSLAEAINDLNSFLLSDAAPSGKPFTAGELLARAEHMIDREGGEADANRVEMLIAIGRQYQIQDEDANARRLLTRAHQLASALPERSTRAKAACALASALGRSGEFERAEKLLQEAESDLPHEPQLALNRVFCLMRGGEVARERGDSKAGLERVQAAQRVLKESRLPAPLLDLRLSIELAEAYRMAGRNREASKTCEEAYARLGSLGRDDTETAGTVLNNWAIVLMALGQPLESERLFRRAIRISSSDGTEQGVSPMLLTNLAGTLVELDRLREARDYAERARAKARRAGNELVVSLSLNRLITVYRRLGDLTRAEQVLSELEPRWRRMPVGNRVHALLASHRALLAQAHGSLPAAMVAADQAVALAEANPQGPDLPILLLHRSDLELQVKRLDEARSDAARALRVTQAAGPGAFSSGTGRAYLALGRALRAQGRPAEARAAFTSALEHLQPSLGADHPETREARLYAEAETRGR